MIRRAAAIMWKRIRSLLMLIGPHVKRGYVSHTLANFGSIMKMIFILRRPAYLKPFRRDASLPRDAFTDRPDLSRYRPSAHRQAAVRSRSSVQTVRSPLQLEGRPGIAAHRRPGRHAPATRPPARPAIAGDSTEARAGDWNRQMNANQR